MKPYIHAKNSARKHGGVPEDYQEIHDFIDSSKMVVPMMTHRTLFHNSFGCFVVEKIFGVNMINSENKKISIRDLAEDHVIEDLGFLPTLTHYLKNIKIENWMLGKENIDHAKNSSIKFGGNPGDYQKIHDEMDLTKASIHDARHKAIYYNSFGPTIIQRIYGSYILNSNYQRVSTRDICELHIQNDLDTIPSLEDWLKPMNPATWMFGMRRSEYSKSMEEKQEKQVD